MDRMTIKARLRKGFAPSWVCPTCNKGHLKLKKESFFESEISNSRDHSHDAWEPQWMRYVFLCQLICDNASCKEVVMCSGEGEVDIDYSIDNDGSHSEEWSDYYLPKYFQPHLNLFEIPKSCPAAVSEPLKESFSLFFTSPSAALNCVRISIEGLLTNLKIKRYDRTSGGLHNISLHRRIGLLPSKFNEHKEMLMASKWLGNAGSHNEKSITHDDVLDAYEFLDHVLHEIYASKAKELIARAKQVNKRKGPIKKSRISF